MREKKSYLVFTFFSTTQAMAFERAAKSEGVPGRLIPVPGDIHAGCGLAWRGDPKTEGSVKELIRTRDLIIEHVYHLIL